VSDKLASKTAIVTGAGQGIGRAIAEKLASEGARVVVNDIDGELAREVAASIDGIPSPGDLTDPDVPDQLLEQALEATGTIDIIVNNAGYVWNSAIHNHSDEQWHAMLEMHATAPFRVLRGFGRWLRQQAAAGDPMPCRKVVNISSVSGLFGAPTQVAYSAGKAALIGITRTLCGEWGRFNVTVNAVAFGHIETRLTAPYDDQPGTIEVKGREHRVGLSRAQIEQQRTRIPLGRPGTPADGANAVYLFCCPESDYVSGEILVAGGGLRG
jgi:3-oxoacyl-[acyl-carrier protein] reductase